MFTPTTTVRSWPALALALFFVAVTGYVLLDDVIAGAPFTTSHLASIAAVVAAVSALHYAWPAIRAGAIVAGLMLALVGASATAYVVVTSGMRNAETATTKAERARKATSTRTAALSTWQRLDVELTSLGQPRSTQGVRAAMDAVVGDGEGKVPLRLFRATAQCTDITKPASAAACRPLLTLRVEMAAAIRKAEIEPKAAAARAALDALPADAPANTGYAHAAQVLAAVPGVDADAATIADRLALLMPFAGVLIGELGIIGFGLLAFGHGRRTVRDFRNVGSFAEAARRLRAIDAAGTFSGNRAAPVARISGPGKRDRQSNVVPFAGKRPAPVAGKHAVVAALESVGGSVASNRELARLMGVTDGEASKRVAEVSALLEVTAVGKARHIALRAGRVLRQS